MSESMSSDPQLPEHPEESHVFTYIKGVHDQLLPSVSASGLSHTEIERREELREEIVFNLKEHLEEKFTLAQIMNCSLYHAFVGSGYNPAMVSNLSEEEIAGMPDVHRSIIEYYNGYVSALQEIGIDAKPISGVVPEEWLASGDSGAHS